MKNYCEFFILIVSLFFLNGCVGMMMAAQPILTGAMVGSDAYNTFGATKTGLKEEKISGELIFNKIAIWPDNECEVFIAEKFNLAKISVITPTEMDKIIVENSLIKDLKKLTSIEMEKSFQIIGEKTETDAILVTNKGKRVFIYSIPQKKEVWSCIVGADRQHNSSHIELMESIANDIALRIIELRQNTQIKKVSAN